MLWAPLQRPTDPDDIEYLYVYQWVTDRSLEQVIIECETYLDNKYTIVIGVYRMCEPYPVITEEDLFRVGLWWEDLLDDYPLSKLC